jgi:uncharacterized protein
MRISSVFQVIKVAAVPLLFAAAALGLATVHVSLQRKAERARNRAAQAVAIQLPGERPTLAGVKLPDLAAAVERGDLLAKIEMGRRLAQGQGVKKNEAQAAFYFQAVIDQAGEIGARDKRGPLVATAFRYMAQFHRRGVAEAHIAANPAYAFGLLHHAASYFGDPIAQCELAKLLMDGDGVTKNPRAAAQWLLSAARKGYAPAQALLGEMLWRGNGVTRVPGDGLGLLAIARRNAAPEDQVWVSKMFETARAEALPAEILEANAFIVQGSQAAHFGVGTGSLIGAEGAYGSITPPPSDEAGQHNPIVHGLSHPLQGLRAGPMIFGLEPVNTELTVEKNDAQTLARIMQMYQIWEQETLRGASLPVRLAGVSK